MGNSPVSKSTQFETEKPNFSRKPSLEVESIGKNSEGNFTIDDVVIRLSLIEFSIKTFKITYQIIIENKKEEDLVIKQIIYNDKIKWWRNFCIQVILPYDNKIISLRDIIPDFKENLLEQMYQNEELSSFKFLILQKKQKIVSEIITYQFRNVMTTSDQKTNELLNQISYNAKNESIFFVAEYINTNLNILDKSYEKIGCTIWKNKIYPISTQKIEFNKDYLFDEKKEKDELKIEEEDFIN
jgi:hypothetical protein